MVIIIILESDKSQLHEHSVLFEVTHNRMEIECKQ